MNAEKGTARLTVQFCAMWLDWQALFWFQVRSKPPFGNVSRWAGLCHFTKTSSKVCKGRNIKKFIDYVWIGVKNSPSRNCYVLERLKLSIVILRAADPDLLPLRAPPNEFKQFIGCKAISKHLFFLSIRYCTYTGSE